MSMKTTNFFLKSMMAMSFCFLFIIISCGNYQMMSYSNLDGIYNQSKNFEKNKKNRLNTDENVYYKNHFKNLANDYSLASNSKNQNFTNVENYYSTESDENLKMSSQAPWGEITSEREVYIINNNPFGFFNYNWGLYNSFFDPYWSFFRPGIGLFNRPFWSLNFYSPFFGYNYPFYRGFFANNMYNRIVNRRYAYSRTSRGYNNYSKLNSSRNRISTDRNLKNNKQHPINEGSGSYENSSNQPRYNVGRRPIKTNDSARNNSSRSINRSNSTSRSSVRNYNSSRSNYSSVRSYSSPNYSSGSTRSGSNSTRGNTSRGR